MKIEIVRKSEYKTSRWAGGTTTELYLYPSHGSYEAREFKIRISSASVEADTSVFTRLPGVERMLTILDGALELKYEGHGSQTLKPYETAAFSGDWNTTSTGRARDFNLMVKDKAQGQMETLWVAPGEIYQLKLEGTLWDRTILFPVEADLKVSKCYIPAGSLAVLEEYAEESCVLHGGVEAGCHVICCRCRTVK